MARITVEDCLTKETNRFSLVLLAAKRTKQLLHGSHCVLAGKCDNKAVVTSLREIADGRVRFMTAQEAEEARLKAEAEERERAASAEAVTPVSSIPTIEFDPSLIRRESLADSGDDEEEDEVEDKKGAGDKEDDGPADLNGDGDKPGPEESF